VTRAVARRSLRCWLRSAPLLIAAACGGPQKLGDSGSTCFRDDDCEAGLICVASDMLGFNRVCSNDPTPLISTVEGPPPIMQMGGSGAGGGGAAGTGGAGATAGQATAGTGAEGGEPPETGGSAGTSGGGNGGANGGAGNGGAGNGGTAGTEPTAGTAGTAGTAPDGGAAG
jgi:hypothetical protein